MIQEILTSLTIIIPIHEFNKELDTEFLTKAIQSIKENKKYLPSEILIVYTKDEFEKYGIDKTIFEGLNVSFLYNDSDKTDFCSQVNLAASKITTEFFSVFEFDDQYGDIAFESFKEYSDAYKNVSVFLPMTIDVTAKDEFIKFTNSEALSRGIVTEGKLGMLSHQTLMMLTSLSSSGAFFKTEDFNQISGFKSSMKISFIYEYLLRATYQDQIVYVIPKLMYLHRNGREGSYLDSINKSDMTKDEVTFWYESARKEFYFNRDREVSYKLEIAQ